MRSLPSRLPSRDRFSTAPGPPAPRRRTAPAAPTRRSARRRAPRADPTALPAVVRDCLAALTAKDADAAILTFTADAVVTDEGRTHRGATEVSAWLRGSAAQWSHRAELTGAQRGAGEQWVAVQHLTGDFPGGVADLTYRFTLRGDRIAELAITG
ncbi:nuclear transport factor 2 family protein [Modestobacter sp. SYSU DS0875]